ncbi:unnamed protein product, partial [Closterium sp. NIES-54]
SRETCLVPVNTDHVLHVLGEVEGGLHLGEVESGLHLGEVEGGLHLGEVEGGLHLGEVEGGLHLGEVEGGSYLGEGEAEEDGVYFISAKSCFKGNPRGKVLPMRHPLRDLPSLLVRFSAVPEPVDGSSRLPEWEWPEGDEAAMKFPDDSSARCFGLGRADARRQLVRAAIHRLCRRPDGLSLRHQQAAGQVRPAASDVWLSAAWLSAAWLSAAWLSAAWLSAAWLSAAWLGAAWLGAAWLGAAWLGAAWLEEASSPSHAPPRYSDLRRHDTDHLQCYLAVLCIHL